MYKRKMMGRKMEEVKYECALDKELNEVGMKDAGIRDERVWN